MMHTEPTAPCTKPQLEAAASPVADIRLLALGEDASAFRTLNEEWIEKHFTLEPKDREVLGDPERTILARGGHVLMAWVDGAVAGCVALIPMSGGIYELSKMAVAPAMRGRGIGRQLLLRAIDHARQIGASSLYLGSNTVLVDAVHLYEAVGFRHVLPENLPAMGYTRANVFMEMPL